MNFHRPKVKKHMQWGMVVAVITVFALFLYGCSAIIKQIGFINVIGIFGQQLETDFYGNTNILLLGTGGGDHDGADLTDTIIVASIDQTNKLVPMVSIPRDFYADKEKIGGGVRINRLYELGKQMYDSETGLELAVEAAEEITGVDIHYYVKIDFQGMKDIVDSLGGVEVYVDEPIHDPYYPLDGTILYQTFSISAGLQEMDGETALKYARSRKTTSDFDRSKRQQKLLFAIKKKAMTKDVLLNPGKIKDLFDAVEDNIETNLTLGHIIELAKISQDFHEENIISRVITDNPIGCGGFLYVPQRDLFGGAFVLVPIGDHFEFIHQYVDLIFHYPELNLNPPEIQLLNGTKTGGLAAETKARLNRLCFDVIRFGNAQNQEINETMIYYKDTSGPEEPEKKPAGLSFIQQLIGGQTSSDIPSIYMEPQYISDADIIIELGEDYVDSRPEDIFYYYFPTQASADEAAADEEEEEGGEADAATEAPAPAETTTE
ncbi:LCP family protein [Patescibacteria group bacterium]